MKATSATCTHQGKVRNNNEDSSHADDELGCYVVCDGMGGHAGGEIASAMAVEISQRVFEARADEIRKARSGELDDEVLLPIVREVIETACTEIHAAASSGDPKHSGMGCTMTIVILGERRAAMGHVGDTRLYLIRDGRTHQLSADHTYAAELARMGTLRWDDVPGHRMNHTLLRAVGTQQTVQVDTLLFDIACDDALILCSDGLTEHVEDPHELSVELDVDDVKEAAESLVARALEEGGKDNVTVVAVSIDARRVRQAPKYAGELDVMKDTYLFEGTTLATRTRVLNRCEIETYEEGATVVADGGVADVLIIVVDGALVVGSDDDAFGPGSILGESMVLEGRKARAAVRAASGARLLTLSAANLRRLSRQHPWLGVRLLERVATRLADRWLGQAPVIF